MSAQKVRMLPLSEILDAIVSSGGSCRNSQVADYIEIVIYPMVYTIHRSWLSNEFIAYPSLSINHYRIYSTSGALLSDLPMFMFQDISNIQMVGYSHEFVNVGFNTIKNVCKYCDQEEGKHDRFCSKRHLDVKYVVRGPDNFHVIPGGKDPSTDDILDTIRKSILDSFMRKP